MPGVGEVLTLTAPQPGDTDGPLPLAQLTEEEAEARRQQQQEEQDEATRSALVATQTKSIGMIHPPPDIRSIVDKTAQFVARIGPEFEKRILGNEKNNVKFNFLNPSDPYHPYYQHKVTEFLQQGADTAAGNGLHSGSSAAAAAATGTAALEAKTTVTPKNEPLLPKADIKQFLKPVKVLVPPEPEHFTVAVPEGLTGQDLDIIKLTAQFVARNGKAFLNGLTSREHINTQFSFLKATHSMYSFFTGLTDAYSKVLMPPKGLIEKLKNDIADKSTLLERCLNRLEWERSQERARQKAEDEIEQERMQMALIDWHDFVVVETIEFAEEEDEGLPQPMSKEEVIRWSKPLVVDDSMEAAAAAMETMMMDEEEMQMASAVAIPTPPVAAASATAAPSGASAAAMPLTTGGVESREMVQVLLPLDEDEPPMRIVKNWKRPEERMAAERDAAASQQQVVLSPITGEVIAIDDMAEHMRVSLIDPKFKEQKERMMAKLRETTLATDDEISRNIVGLARTRPDIFGTTEEEVSNAVKAEIEKKKEEPKQVIWDGHTGSISRTANQAMAHTITIEEQTARERATLAAGPAAPPKPAALRPLPPPPGLAVNLPRVQPVSTTTAAGVVRAAILANPGGAVRALRPPPPPPPPPPPMMMHPHHHQYAMARGGYVGGMMLPLPPHLGGMPPLPDGEAPPLPPDEPDSKRMKLEEMHLIPEHHFLMQFQGPAVVMVMVPNVEGESNMKGQMLEINVESLGVSVSSVKEKIAMAIGLPSNKQKLSGSVGVMRDNLSLGYYNVAPGHVVSLALRERGGRKK